MSALTVQVWNPTRTVLKGTITGPLAPRFQAPRGDIGSFSFFLPKSDPYNATQVVAIDDVVQFLIDGTDAWPGIVTTIGLTAIADGDELNLGWQITGVGAMAAWQRSLVYPPMGIERQLFSDTRVFNYASPELDISGWDVAREVEKSLVGERFGIPELFPDPDAYWIWNSQQPGAVSLGDVSVVVNCDFTWSPVNWSIEDDGFPPPGVGNMDEFLGDAGPYINLLEDLTWIAEGGWDPAVDGCPIGPPFVPPDYTQPSSFAPPGDCYFGTTFEMAEAGFVEQWAAADDRYELWVDGVLTASDQTYYKGQTTRKKFYLEAGFHSVRARATNLNLAKAGFLASWILLNTDGTYGDVVCRTDGTWKMLAYPASPPGFTAGQIGRILKFEASAQRGGLANVAPGWFDDIDSNGALWPVIPEFAVQIGLTVYDAYVQLAAEGHWDLKQAADDMRLDAYLHDTSGATVPVTYVNNTGDPDVDPILELAHEIRGVGST